MLRSDNLIIVEPSRTASSLGGLCAQYQFSGAFENEARDGDPVANDISLAAETILHH